MNTVLKMLCTLDRLFVFLFMCALAYIAYINEMTIAFILFLLFALFFAFYMFKSHNHKPLGVLGLNCVIIVMMMATFIEKMEDELTEIAEYNWIVWLVLSFAIVDTFYIMLLNYKGYKEQYLTEEDK